MSLDEERRIWEEKARRAEEEAVASGSRFRYLGEIVDGKIVTEDQDTIIRNRIIRRLNRGELQLAEAQKSNGGQSNLRRLWK